MDYMEQALSLAKLALGQASPNPAVGAVVVKEGVVVGQGYTQPPGSSHAEVIALKQAAEQARGGCDVCYAGTLLPSWSDSTMYRGNRFCWHQRGSYGYA